MPPQGAGLLADCRNDPRVAVPRIVDREPGEEVEVLPAVGVPKPGALAADELHRCPRVGGHRVAPLEALQAGDAHLVTMVPMPASVNSSSSSEWGRRPSTM